MACLALIILHPRPHRGRPSQPNRIPRPQRIDKMIMLDPRRLRLCKLPQRPLHIIPLPFYQVRTDEEARSVIAVMTMHAYRLLPLLFLILGCQLSTQPVNQGDEVAHLRGRRRNLGDGGELVVLHAAFFEGVWRVLWGVVGDVDDGVDLGGPVGEEGFGGVFGVLFAEGLEGTEEDGW
jgi:hypothetical protein